MRLMLELGRRVQLQSMDTHCGDITIGLYERPDGDGRSAYVVHSYSSKEGVADRLAFIARAMISLGGMAAVGGEPTHLRWTCGDYHLTATKRLFIEACKLPGSDSLAVRPAALQDAKLGGMVEIVPQAAGRYEIVAQAGGSGQEARLKAICAGYLKLAEMQRWDQSETGVQFGCGTPHDALMRLLLFRALNARSALREVEMMASRGVLAAPSAQAP